MESQFLDEVLMEVLLWCSVHVSPRLALFACTSGLTCMNVVGGDGNSYEQSQHSVEATRGEHNSIIWNRYKHYMSCIGMCCLYVVVMVRNKEASVSYLPVQMCDRMF